MPGIETRREFAEVREAGLVVGGKAISTTTTLTLACAMTCREAPSWMTAAVFQRAAMRESRTDAPAERGLEQ